MEFPEDYGSPMFYDIDAGRKMSLARGIETSPVRYHIMRSGSPRFEDPAGARVPFGVYNTDTGSKQSLESVARDNRRFYSSCFQSKVPRFPRPWTSPATDQFYDTERTMDYDPATVGKVVETTAQKYSILRSKYKRFPDKPVPSEAPDVIYTVDCGNKETMYTSMLHSPVTYKTMASTTHKFGPRPHTHHGQLGPGTYDYPHPRDILVSTTLNTRPLSTLASRTPRFRNRMDPTKGLGSTWRQDKDTKSWTKHGITISKAEYLRPQYMPKSYGAQQHPVQQQKQAS